MTTRTENPGHERDDGAMSAGFVGRVDYHPYRTARQPSFAPRSPEVSEQEFQQILDLTPLFVTVLGPRRERLYVNRMGLDYLGTTHNRWRDTRPDAELHPEDLEPVQFHWNRAFSNDLSFECEFRSRRRDGTYRWLLGRCTTVRNEEGSVHRWHAAFTDIDERKRAEERLRQEKATFRAVIALDNSRLQRVLDYVAANLMGDMTLENLAAIAGYSTFHFARKFTIATGIPPHRYIGRMRLENAMAELEEGKLPLAEIAFNARFSSQASFTRAFHRAIGMTPNEYRRRRRGEPGF